MLLDVGSNADNLFAEMSTCLGITESGLKLMTSPRFGVRLVELPVLGWIHLPLVLKGTLVKIGEELLVKIGEELFTSTMARFIVIDVQSSYNTILSRQT